MVGLVNEEQPLTVLGMEARGADAVRQATANNLTVYPNPINHMTEVAFIAQQAGTAQVTVYDQLGRALNTEPVAALPGRNVFQLSQVFDRNQYAHGVYHLSVQLEGETHQVKLVH